MLIEPAPLDRGIVGLCPWLGMAREKQGLVIDSLAEWHCSTGWARQRLRVWQGVREREGHNMH